MLLVSTPVIFDYLSYSFEINSAVLSYINKTMSEYKFVW